MSAFENTSRGISEYATGIYPDVPADIYHRRELGMVSAGVLRLLSEKTPAHYRHWVVETDEGDTPAKVFGRAYHDRILLPELFARMYVGEPLDAPARPTDSMRNARNPNKSSIERVAFWNGWNAKNDGKIVMTAEDFALIEAMHSALMRDSYISSLFGDGKSESESEVTLRWNDYATGLPCKARADHWLRRERKMVDLKTTDDASPRGFARSVVKYGYDITHAHYAEGAKSCGEPIDQYLIVAQEKKAPYLCAVYQLDTAAESRGYEIRQRGMETMAVCLASNAWPGFPSGVQPLSLPGWAITNEMEIDYVD